jgi:hypothetical protein
MEMSLLGICIPIMPQVVLKMFSPFDLFMEMSEDF